MELDFKGVFIESLLVTTGFAALGAILFWLIAGRYWGKAKTKPFQLGLWCGAWLVAASVMAAGGKYYPLGFEELFFRMILTVPILFVVGFLAGFGFRKLKVIASTSPVVANTPSNISGASDVHFAEAMAEIEESRMDNGLWARCFAESDGEHEKAKASYIRQRVVALAAVVMPSANVDEMVAKDVKPSASVAFDTPTKVLWIVLLVFVAVSLGSAFYFKAKASLVKGAASAEGTVVDGYERECKAGNAKACNESGEIYWKQGFKENSALPRALDFYIKACDLAYGEGCANAARYHSGGLGFAGITSDKNKTFELFSKACDLGNADGCYQVSSMYMLGEGVAENRSLACRFSRKSCDLGDGFGCVNVGLMYEKGSGTCESLQKYPDYFKAFDWYVKACNLKDDFGCFTLAKMYENGNGVIMNLSKALSFFGKACDLKMQEACKAYARMKRNGVN